MSIQDNFKARLTPLRIGGWLARMRCVSHSTKAMWFEPEKAGNLIQDQIYLSLLPNLCPVGGVFVDVGSHIGSVIASVLRNNPNVTVHAIEAVPSKAEAIRRRFPMASVHACAVGPSDGEVAFYIDRRRTAFSSLDNSAGRYEAIVRMRKLDDIVTYADVVKIDVEGHEVGVLRGAERLIGNAKPILAFESARHEKADELWEWLFNHDYVVYSPDRFRHTGPPLARESFLDYHYYPRRCTNYLAVPVNVPVPPIKYVVERGKRKAVGIGSIGGIDDL